MVKNYNTTQKDQTPNKSHTPHTQTQKKQDIKKHNQIHLHATKKKSRKTNNKNLPSSDSSQEQLSSKSKILLAKQSRSNQISPDNKHNNQNNLQMMTPTNQNNKKDEKSISINEEFPLQYYTGRTTYKLDTFNSITIRQGQIYNLLEDPFSRQKLKKEVKCNCSQSRCKAKYCICYSKGKRCGQDCGCTNCANIIDPIRQKDQQEPAKSCKCQKSHCLKNYCECRRDGQFCNPECRCLNCMNNKPGVEDRDPKIQKSQKLQSLVNDI